MSPSPNQALHIRFFCLSKINPLCGPYVSSHPIERPQSFVPVPPNLSLLPQIPPPLFTHTHEFSLALSLSLSLSQIFPEKNKNYKMTKSDKNAKALAGKFPSSLWHWIKHFEVIVLSHTHAHKHIIQIFPLSLFFSISSSFSLVEEVTMLVRTPWAERRRPTIAVGVWICKRGRGVEDGGFALEPDGGSEWLVPGSGLGGHTGELRGLRVSVSNTPRDLQPGAAQPGVSRRGVVGFRVGS